MFPDFIMPNQAMRARAKLPYQEGHNLFSVRQRQLAVYKIWGLVAKTYCLRPVSILNLDIEKKSTGSQLAPRDLPFER
jgi:hypothetical protein